MAQSRIRERRDDSPGDWPMDDRHHPSPLFSGRPTDRPRTSDYPAYHHRPIRLVQKPALFWRDVDLYRFGRAVSLALVPGFPAADDTGRPVDIDRPGGTLFSGDIRRTVPAIFEGGSPMGRPARLMLAIPDKLRSGLGQLLETV